jgi:hypothetical protein
MRIILSTLDENNTIETKALLDSGCTGSCVDRSFVIRNHISTRKLVRPIPVYNADRTLNKGGAITETVELRMVIQDHVERILFDSPLLTSENRHIPLLGLKRLLDGCEFLGC